MSTLYDLIDSNVRQWGNDLGFVYHWGVLRPDSMSGEYLFIINEYKVSVSVKENLGGFVYTLRIYSSDVDEFSESLNRPQFMIEEPNLDDLTVYAKTWTHDYFSKDAILNELIDHLENKHTRKKVYRTDLYLDIFDKKIFDNYVVADTAIRSFGFYNALGIITKNRCSDILGTIDNPIAMANLLRGTLGYKFIHSYELIELDNITTEEALDILHQL